MLHWKTAEIPHVASQKCASDPAPHIQGKSMNTILHKHGPKCFKTRQIWQLGGLYFCQSLCASFLGKERKKGPHKFYRGDLGGQKQGPKRAIFGHEMFSFFFSALLRDQFRRRGWLPEGSFSSPAMTHGFLPWEGYLYTAQALGANHTFPNHRSQHGSVLSGQAPIVPKKALSGRFLLFRCEKATIARLSSSSP